MEAPRLGVGHEQYAVKEPVVKQTHARHVARGRLLLQTVRRAASENSTGILMVEQHVPQALNIADRVYVMQRGRIVMSGTAEEVRGRIDEVEATYLSDQK